MREKELILYREFGEEGKLLEKMAWLMDHYTEAEGVGRCGAMLYECMHDLLEQAGLRATSGIAILRTFWSTRRTAIAVHARSRERRKERSMKRCFTIFRSSGNFLHMILHR